MATRTHCAHCYFAPSAKYFTVCITYQPSLVIHCISLHPNQCSLSTHITWCNYNFWANIIFPLEQNLPFSQDCPFRVLSLWFKPSSHATVQSILSALLENLQVHLAVFAWMMVILTLTPNVENMVSNKYTRIGGLGLLTCLWYFIRVPTCPLHPRKVESTRSPIRVSWGKP